MLRKWGRVLLQKYTSPIKISISKMKILKQELKPGMRIIEQELSEEFGVSRGPIREALRQLEQEGMIVYTRNVGCSVKEITLEDIYEIYLLSATYEKLAVKEYNGEFSDSDIRKMERILERMKHIKDGDIHKVVELDNELHKIIVEKAELPRLLKSWRDLQYGDIISCYAGQSDRSKTIERQYPIHEVLVEACRTKNVDTICNAITDHYMSTIKRLMQEEKM